jgi:molybdate transport system ATP-binding protein
MEHRLGALRVDVEFALTQPWTILFGPSGCGKTTILRAIAGLLRPDVGRIVSISRPDTDWERRRPVVETASGFFLPTHKRRIAMAAQKPNLFPHLTVRENVAYGMVSLIQEGTIEEDGAEMSVLPMTDVALGLLRIGHLAEKRPAALSGGEAQRVNLARVVSAARGLLLLDEPFTGLDLALRSELIDDLRGWAAKRKLCVLSVTHDVAEAFELGAEVIKIADGGVVAQGRVGVVLGEERKRLIGQLGG